MMSLAKRTKQTELKIRLLTLSRAQTAAATPPLQTNGKPQSRQRAERFAVGGSDFGDFSDFSAGAASSGQACASSAAATIRVIGDVLIISARSPPASRGRKRIGHGR
jgi:hypothetical protein